LVGNVTVKRLEKVGIRDPRGLPHRRIGGISDSEGAGLKSRGGWRSEIGAGQDALNH
jgi:hypothetical protein